MTQLKLFKMDTNDLRDQQQKKALNHWAINGFTGSIVAGTGFGKSRCGVIAVGETIKRLTEYNDAGERVVHITALVLVPTTQLKDQFRVEMTYNSNAIEGNSLTLKETFLVINEGITVKGKPLKDHLEENIIT